jgi:hypothetical protein
MPSNSEVLTLVAQVQNKFSQPIRDMQRSLRDLGEHGRAAHIEGARYSKMHTAAFQDLRKSMRETSEGVKGLLQPAMVGLGISAIGTGAAIAGITKSIKEFAASSREMAFLSKETWLTVNKLNAVTAAGERANVSVGTMTQNLVKMNENLSQFEKRRDSALQTFFAANRGVAVIAHLEDELRAHKGDRDAQLSAIQDAYKNIKDADAHLLEESGLGGAGRRVTNKMIEEGAKAHHQYTAMEIADGKALADSFDDTREAASRLSEEIGVSLGHSMKEVSAAAGEFINEHGKDMKEFLSAVADDLKSADWKGFAEGIGSAATEAKKLIDAFGGTNAVEAILALKFGGAPGLVALGAYKMLPSPTNEAESEIERQKKLGMPQPPTVDLHGAAPAAPDKNPAGGGFRFFKDKPPSIWEYENPSAEKMSYRGRIPDLQKEGAGGFQKAAFRTGEETPGAEIRAEAVMTRATMRGTAEGSRIGVLNAFHELEDEKRRGAGIQTAAYHPGGAAGEGGLGGGYGGLGGGSGGGLGGGSGGGSSAGGGSPASVASMKGPHGHPGQRAIVEGHVKEAAATIKAAKAAMAGGDAQAGGNPTMAQMVAYARNQAIKSGVDPDIATGIMMQEGGLKKPGAKFGPWGHSDPSKSGKPGTAYGPFQIRTSAQGGMGSDFLRAHPELNGKIDASSWQKQIDFSIHQMARSTSPWMAVGDSGGIGAIKRIGHGFNTRYAAEIEAAGKGVASHGEAQPVKPNDYSKIMPSKGGALKDNMSRSEIDAWNEAHKRGTGVGQTPDAHGANLRDRLKAAHSVHAEAGLHDIKGNVKDFHDPEFDKSEKQRAAAIAAAVAPARIGLLKGAHPMPTQEDIEKALRHYRAGQEAYKRNQKSLRDKALMERQGEANYGRGATDFFNHEGFKPWPGQNIPDKGIVPGHDIGKHHRGEQDPAWRPRGYGPDGGKNPDAKYWNHQHMERADLLGNARKAGMMGAEHKVTGSASLSVDFKNMPRGVKAKTKIDGMFSQIRVARGRAMPLANQDS